MKKSRIIAPALGVLVLSTAASITGTVAWFTANNSVQVTGMTVKTKVGSNLMITDAATPTESDFFAGTLNQAHSNVLVEPVSSTNGQTFFYTVNAKGDGSAVVDAEGNDYVAYNTGVAAPTNDQLIAFNQAYGIENPESAVGYVDYTYYLKATSSKDNQKVSLKMCKMLYNSAVLQEKAWRVGVFAVSQTSIANLASATPALVSILGTYDAKYFNNTAVSGLDTKAAASNYNSAATIDGDLDAGVTKYYKVITRLWLEGEDTTCNNDTYAQLTNAWSLDLGIELGTNAGINHIALADADATASGATATVALVTDDEPAEANAYQWYQLNGEDPASAIDGATAASYTLASGEKDVYCVVTLKDGTSTKTSNTVHVKVA